jgi:hypothetical protein
VWRMGIEMFFRVMGFVVRVRRCGEIGNCNVFWGMGIVVRVRRCGKNEIVLCFGEWDLWCV